ncbi:MAG: hypothetical protein LBB91_09130 [Clostridiales bacterium]|jgi:septum site-determining protein MinC|nr:hypothetical protein [Clostridiales bacterium]
MMDNSNNSDKLVSIKGNRHGLVFYFNTKEAKFQELSVALEEKLLASGDFFQEAKYFISEDSEFSDKEEAIICQILEKYHLQKGVMPAKRAQEDPSGSETTYYRPAGSQALFFTRSFRSGQSIQADADVVILGDVNSGAEIIASGSIIVAGSCQGILHAGYPANREAYIIVLALGPSQLRIGDITAYLPKGKTATGPEMALCQGEDLQVLPYNSQQLATLFQAQSV